MLTTIDLCSCEWLCNGIEHIHAVKPGRKKERSNAHCSHRSSHSDIYIFCICSPIPKDIKSNPTMFAIIEQQDTTIEL